MQVRVIRDMAASPFIQLSVNKQATSVVSQISITA
jgi:hypothetical protein